jgi:uncharacterized SAM-binding protein YcdF (DUF218 family)
MEVLITRSLEALLFPPGIAIVMILAGLAVIRRLRRTALALCWTAIAILYLCSTPLVAYTSLQSLERIPALTRQQLNETNAQAIVVLAGGLYANPPEYDGDNLGPGTLARLQYGAYLHRQTALPVLVSGGAPLDETTPIADTMARVLREDFHIDHAWIENRSRTTGENALFTRELLSGKGIDRILLVTHAWHMPRSRAIFQQSGLQVTPAPTRFSTHYYQQGTVLQFLPNAGALNVTRTALHEMLGRTWYALRYQGRPG